MKQKEGNKDNSKALQLKAAGGGMSKYIPYIIYFAIIGAVAVGVPRFMSARNIFNLLTLLIKPLHN